MESLSEFGLSSLDVSVNSLSSPPPQLTGPPLLFPLSEAESKEKHGVWDPTVVDYNLTRVDYYTFTMDNPMPESTRDLGFGLCSL